MSQYAIVIDNNGEVFEFTCAAEDYFHAIEQAENAYSQADVIG